MRPGRPLFFYSTLIVKESSINTNLQSCLFSGPFLIIHHLQSSLILRLETAMLAVPIVSTIKKSFSFLFSPSSIVGQILAANATRIHQHQAFRNRLQYLVKTGAWASATTPALTVGSMESAPSVEDSTEQRKLMDAERNSKKEEERGLVMQRVEAAEVGPRKFISTAKQKLEDSDFTPRFRRRFLWTDSGGASSPAVRNTEFAKPFLPPPAHLLDNPDIRSSLNCLRDHVKVETPFDVDKLELFLIDHPNQPFVKSVITGL
jgi:hypothetical protein